MRRDLYEAVKVWERTPQHVQHMPQVRPSLFRG
jgi:hypothetical protein